MKDLVRAFEDHQRTIAGLEPLLPNVARVAARMRASLAAGGKIVWMGNGGSAADAQHMAAELVGRFEREREGLASIALTTDTSLLTAVANDYGFEHVFARQVRALCRAEDVVVGISTSGKSRNVLEAMAAARVLGAHTVGLTGKGGGDMTAACDDCLVVPSDDTARIQEAHALIGHLLCSAMDRE